MSRGETEREAASRRFLAALETGRMPHGVLIAGPKGSGRTALAERAAVLWCTGRDDVNLLENCPDCLRVTGNTVEDARAIREELGKRPFSDGRRAVLIYDAHRKNVYAQNSILKILEEPPANTLFLLEGVEAGLLPTIRSRCAVIRLGPEPYEAVLAQLIRQGVPRETAEVCAAASGGVAGAALELAQSEERQALRREAHELLTLSAQGTPAMDRARLIADQGAEGAEFALQCMLSLLGDVLRLKNGGACRENPDGLGSVRTLAETFTSGQIQGMINILFLCLERLDSGVGAAGAMDFLALQLLKIRRKLEG